MLDYGDYLVMDKGRTTYDPNGSNFLIPEIAGSGAGTKLTAVLKGIQPEGCKGSMPTYADFRVTTLPTEPSAGGLRHGACDMLATVMPAELGAHFPHSNPPLWSPLSEVSIVWRLIDR